MEKARKVTAIVGTYRKGGIIDQATDQILASASEQGAEVKRIYLVDKHIEFCANCRRCTLQPGSDRGKCPTVDDMAAILDAIEASDGIILASPTNFSTVTAVTKRFMERLICYAYWPWGTNAPDFRRKQKTKRAVIVASSQAPTLMARTLTPIVGLLKKTAGLLGAKTVGVLFIGWAAREEKQQLTAKTQEKARRLGKKLVA